MLYCLSVRVVVCIQNHYQHNSSFPLPYFLFNFTSLFAFQLHLFPISSPLLLLSFKLHFLPSFSVVVPLVFRASPLLTLSVSSAVLDRVWRGSCSSHTCYRWCRTSFSHSCVTPTPTRNSGTRTRMSMSVSSLVSGSVRVFVCHCFDLCFRLLLLFICVVG